jgi:hypothetical protein
LNGGDFSEAQKREQPDARWKFERQASWGKVEWSAIALAPRNQLAATVIP